MLKPLTLWITTNCEIFWKRWEYQTTLPASWEICMQVKKQQWKPDMEQRTGSKTGKGGCQGCVLSPCLFNLYAEYIRWNARLDEAQALIKIAGRNINNLRYADDTTLEEINPDYSLEGLMLKLKLQYLGNLMGRTDSLEKTLMLGKVESRRRRGWQRMRWLDGIKTQWTWVWASSGRWWRTERPGMLQPKGL